MKTGWVLYETIRSGELTPGYEPITIYPESNETFEAVFKTLCPKEYVYKGVFENRNDAISWVDNWIPECRKAEVRQLSNPIDGYWG